MTITAEIAKVRHNYILRAVSPGVIFTVLNPDQKILDEFIRTNKTVSVEGLVISGDNVNIEMIDGKKYLQGTLREKFLPDANCS